MTLPTVITSAGLVPRAPVAIRNSIVTEATVLSPGLTADLPASLIDDMSGTAAGAAVQCDQARVEAVNSLTPYGANAFLLNQLGIQCGIPAGTVTNTSVFCVFTCNTAGYVVERGFTVSDGVNQFTVRDATIVPSSLSTDPVYCVAVNPGPFAVPRLTVTTIIGSVPGSITLSVSNPLAGTPQAAPETEEGYRSRVIRGQRASSVGMPTFLYTKLCNVPGVDPRLTVVAQINGGGWEIICGGTGDPYQIGYAIFQGTADISTLQGSIMVISAITNATNGQVTTVLNHGLSTGTVVTITGASPGAFNGTYTITVGTRTNFLLNVNTTGFGTYTGGGVVNPNPRNQVVTITQSPNAYNIPFVVPPSQSVSITMTWNTTTTNVISDDSVDALGTPAIVNYINSIQVGQPINRFALQDAFATAIASIIDENLLSRMVVSVEINGTPVSPISGTMLFAGDPESYFQTNNTLVTVVRG